MDSISTHSRYPAPGEGAKRVVRIMLRGLVGGILWSGSTGPIRLRCPFLVHSLGWIDVTSIQDSAPACRLDQSACMHSWAAAEHPKPSSFRCAVILFLSPTTHTQATQAHPPRVAALLQVWMHACVTYGANLHQCGSTGPCMTSATVSASCAQAASARCACYPAVTA